LQKRQKNEFQKSPERFILKVRPRTAEGFMTVGNSIPAFAAGVENLPHHGSLFSQQSIFLVSIEEAILLFPINCDIITVLG